MIYQIDHVLKRKKYQIFDDLHKFNLIICKKRILYHFLHLIKRRIVEISILFKKKFNASMNSSLDSSLHQRTYQTFIQLFQFAKYPNEHLSCICTECSINSINDKAMRTFPVYDVYSLLSIFSLKI